MIEHILNDAVDLLPVADESPFETSVDYATELKKRDEATQAWKVLTAKERSSHKDKIENYLISSGVIDIKSAEAQRAKNLYLLRNEIAAHIQGDSPIKLLNVEELHFSSSLTEHS